MKTRRPATRPAATRSVKRRTFIQAAEGSRILRLRRGRAVVSPRTRARHVSPWPAAHVARRLTEIAPCPVRLDLRRRPPLAAACSPPPAPPPSPRRWRSRRRRSRSRRRSLARAGAAGRRAPSSRCGSTSLQGRRRGRRRRRRDARADGLLQPERAHARRQAAVPARAGPDRERLRARRRRPHARRGAGREGARAAGVRGHLAAPRRPRPACRRRVGNNYELRVYPLLPGKTRTVELRIVEPASSAPAGAARLRRSRRRASICAARSRRGGARPSSIGAQRARPALRARRERRLHRPHDAQRRRPAARAARAAPAAAAGTAARVATEERDGQSYFTLELPVARRSAPRPLPHRVQIVWDASGSGAHARSTASSPCSTPTSRRCATRAVNLVRVADVAAAPMRFDVRGGDWCALRRALEATVYDGASNLGAVRHDGVSAEALWFSDGLANYGAPWQLAFPVPVYAINSAASSDPAALQALADASGGRSIDLGERDAPGRGRRAAAPRQRRSSSIGALGAQELVVQSQSAAAGRLVVAGMLTATERRGHAAPARRERRADDARRAVHAGAQSVAPRGAAVGAPDARLARRRGAHEQGPHPRDRQALRPGDARDLADRPRAGRRLRAPRDRAAGRAARRLRPRARQRRRSAAPTATPRGWRRWCSRFEARVAWWSRDFPKGDRAGAAADRASRKRAADALGALAAPLEARRGASAATACATRPRTSAAPRRRAMRQRRTAAAPSAFAAQAETETLARAEESRPRRRPAGRDDDLDRADAGRATRAPRSSACRRHGPTSGRGSTSTSGAPTRANVGFFLDAAEFFLAKDDRDNRALGLRALSNLAEMDLQNRQVLRLLAYRLQQAGESDAGACRSSSASSSWRRTSRNRTATSASRSPTPARRRRAIEHLYAVVTGALGRALRRHRPDRADRAERGRRPRHAATAEPVDVSRDRAAPAEEPAARRARRPRLGRRQHRRRPARDRSERRGGLLRPQRSRTRAARSATTRPAATARRSSRSSSPSRAGTASRPTSSAIASRC